MKTIRTILVSLLIVLVGYPAFSLAEDIDIYSASISNGAPNIMFVIDNAANSNASGMSACAYSFEAGGGPPSAGETKSLGSYQCALANIVADMTPNADGSAVVNLGIITRCGVHFPLTPIDDNPYPGSAVAAVTKTVCADPHGIVFTIPQGSTNKEALILAAKALEEFNGQAAQGAQLQETWAYYTGGNGGETGTGILSGTVYAGTNAIDGCQKNYIIFLSGVTPSSHGLEDSSHLEMSRIVEATGYAVTANILTAAQKTALDTIITPTLEDGFGREWARFMKSVDINTTAEGTGSQTIITYSVATGDTAVPPATITDDMESYIKAISTYGGGKYYPAGNDSTVLSNSILKILNEVQAVNSVFSSSSLPVSVNAQGTYLNQIYMGMFRPDQDGNPRWVGNLKQYHFVATRDATTHLISLTLADSLDASALNPATGFITPNAVSYWTSKNLLAAPDSTGGFWVNDSLKTDSAGGAFDSPDGEWVDKGGAAQMARLSNLTSDYTTAAGTATNPRKLYTCTGTCTSGNSLSGFPFANSNASLTGSLFGIIAPVSITSLTRTGNTATVTATAHGVSDGQVVQVSGADQSEYNGSFVMTYVNANTLTYPISVSPVSPATGTILANVPTGAAIAITSLTRSGTTVTVNAPGNTFADGDSVSISGVTPSDYNGSWTISCAGSCDPEFTFTGPAEGPTTPSGGGSAAVSGYTTRTIAATTANPNPGFVRSGTTVTVATTANHGFPNTGTVTISGADDSDYNGIYSFTKTGNRTFTYTLPCATPCSPATVLGTVTGASADSVSVGLTLALGAGTAATVTATSTDSLTAAPFNLVVGNSYLISISGAGQSQYNGTFTATVTSATTFTYPITTSPATPATGTMTLGSSLATSDLINWVRGKDSTGEEFGPGGSVTIRPSLHGDVLHSRPVAVNYSGTTGVVIYYGGNDGVFRAVNGNQTAAIGSVPAGGELWSFIPTEFFSKLKRQHDNSPILDLPSTIPGISPAPQDKDYFADGSTGIYQRLNADGTTNTAYLYMSMRRGGRLIYALNVTNPADPKFLWKITNTGDFTELGQTWSAPKVALIKGYNDGSGNAKPVLIFGAGYSTTQDTEPATADTMGRGIYIVDAVTGELVWRATYGASSACSAVGDTPAICTVSGMNYSIPSDITLMDRDSDGFIDRLYAVDVGGNVWRVDLQREGNLIHNTPDYWKVNKVASLGGSSPLRKFFYPPDVVPTGTFDAVIAASGDREHPFSTTTQDRIFMLKDLTGNDGSGLTTIVNDDLFEKTSANTYTAVAVSSGGDTPNKGFFIDFLGSEKAVNAPLTVAGFTYLGTNQPTASDSCSANLGIARGYKLNPLTGAYTFTVYVGGGLPPSPVAGVVSVTVAGEDTAESVPFCIGCGGDPDCVGADCTSALGGGKPDISVPTSRTRTYWYQEMD